MAYDKDTSTPCIEEVKFQVEWLKTHLPRPGINNYTIKQHTTSTYEDGQEEMSKGKWNTSQILVKYPRLRDFPQLIFHDFMTAYGKAACFETNFLGTYAPLILRAAEKENISIPDIEDESLNLLIVLLKPVPNLKRIKGLSQEVIIKRVICFIKANDDTIELARERKPHLLKSPFICCLNSSRQKYRRGFQDPVFFLLFRIPYPTLF